MFLDLKFNYASLLLNQNAIFYLLFLFLTEEQYCVTTIFAKSKLC